MFVNGTLARLGEQNYSTDFSLSPKKSIRVQTFFWKILKRLRFARAYVAERYKCAHATVTYLEVLPTYTKNTKCLCRHVYKRTRFHTRTCG